MAKVRPARRNKNRIREYPFYLDMSLIFGLDAKDIDDAYEKIKPAVKEIHEALKGKTNVMSLTVYSVYEKDAATNKFKVALRNKDDSSEKEGDTGG